MRDKSSDLRSITNFPVYSNSAETVTMPHRLFIPDAEEIGALRKEKVKYSLIIHRGMGRNDEKTS